MKHKIDEYHIRCVANDILTGLSRIHKQENSQKVIHRDIALDNILIRHNSEHALQVCINDFDLMREVAGENNRYEANTRVGKEEYIAPEVQRVLHQLTIRSMEQNTILLVSMFTH